MNNKAQSLSINTIVIAAIALIVLVVLIAVFGGRIRMFLTGTRSCESQGGICYEGTCSEYGSTEGGIYTNLPGTSCEDLGPEHKCCVPLANPLT